jgi:hypothetical protein
MLYSVKQNGKMIKNGEQETIRKETIVDSMKPIKKVKSSHYAPQRRVWVTGGIAPTLS